MKNSILEKLENDYGKEFIDKLFEKRTSYNYGWVCSKCGASNNPNTQTCSCSFQGYKITCGDGVVKFEERVEEVNNGLHKNKLVPTHLDKEKIENYLVSGTDFITPKTKTVSTSRVDGEVNMRLSLQDMPESRQEGSTIR